MDDPRDRGGSASPGPRAVTFAHALLGLGVALSLSQVVFAVQLHRPLLLKVLPLAAAALLAAARGLRPARRVVAALSILPAIPLVYGAEWRIARARPYDATMAEARGQAFDTRTAWEVIRDARRGGAEAYPLFKPRALLVLDPRAVDADEIQNHVVSAEWGVEIGGERVLPLGGVSNKQVVTCNEGGRYAVYESDEHGFNNPKGIWPRDAVDVAMLGDSFTQGACVGAGEDAAAWIRRRYPATLNLGMAGNGPLLELAGLEELVAPKKPRIVLWVYYNNDMADLDVERQVPLLRRYLDERGFSQDLLAKQAEIDAGLVALSRRIEALAPAWPGFLDRAGVTRGAAPVWLGDLIMGEQHASASAVLRLDRLAWGITSRAVVDYFHAAPDLPLFRRVLARAKADVASWGGELFFVYMADAFFLQYRGRREHHNRQAVLALARDLGVPVLDAQPAFLAAPDPSALFYHPESHCNPAGYELLADVILRGLDGG